MEPISAHEHMASTLRITSNIEPESTNSGDILGPFVMGHNLTIVCSTDISEDVSLSWLEGDKQLAAVTISGNGNVSRSFIVGTLQAKDSQRHFTCRELVSGTEKSVDLRVVDDHMEIQKDGISLKDEGEVDVILSKGFNLKCVVNGTDPSTGSWWEGNKKLPAKRTTSNKAIHNQLVLGPARIEDDGRKLTCRARNGQLTKTVVLNVVEGPVPGTPSPSLQARPLAVTTTGTRPTTKPLPTTDNEVKVYLVAVITVIFVVEAIRIFVIVKMYKKIMKKVSSTSRQEGDSPEHGGSKNSSSKAELSDEHGPQGSTTLVPLMPRPPHVEGGDEKESSGGRMSVMRPANRDHS